MLTLCMTNPSMAEMPLYKKKLHSIITAHLFSSNLTSTLFEREHEAEDIHSDWIEAGFLDLL